MDGIIKIAIVGDNLIDKLDIINCVKSKFPEQFFVPMDTKNMASNFVFEEYWQNFNAVFYLGNDDSPKESILHWLGHNHFRFIYSNDYNSAVSAVCYEMNIIINDIELEKKLLIEIPNIAELASKYPVSKAHIEQTYLNCPKGTHRIRMRTSNGVESYFETIKIRLTNSKCVESENIIDKKMYYLLMKEKDTSMNTIVKDRYFILYKGNRFEMDLYEFWDNRCTVELEIPNENYRFELPSEFKLIKDVSDDYTYKNKYLASLSYEDCKAKIL